MSHRALIAERQRNDRFNVYYSRNGADDIQLLDELRDSLNVHGGVDWESLNGRAAPEMTRQLAQADETGYRMETPASDAVVEPKPLGVNVREEELLAADGLLEFEVLYVVDDGDVEAYWLAWAYPDVIRPWRDHIEVDVYDTPDTPTDPDKVMGLLDDGDPAQTISEFGRGWLTDDPVPELVRANHRWIYELHSMATRKVDTTEAETVSQVVQTPEYLLAFRADTHEPLVPPAYAHMLPIHIESPPTASAQRISETAAQTRFRIGAGLNAADEPTEEQVTEACADAVQELVRAYPDRVAAEFIPRPLGGLVETYRHAIEQLKSGNIGRS